jgi:uncharacterized membrane protein YfbV (UPF0208 family)
LNKTSQDDAGHALRMSQRIAAAVLVVSLVMAIRLSMTTIVGRGDAVVTLLMGTVLANTAWLGRRAFTKMEFMIAVHRDSWDPRIRRRLVVLHLTDVAVLMTSAMGLVRCGLLVADAIGRGIL